MSVTSAKSTFHRFPACSSDFAAFCQIADARRDARVRARGFQPPAHRTHRAPVVRRVRAHLLRTARTAKLRQGTRAQAAVIGEECAACVLEQALFKTTSGVPGCTEAAEYE